MSTYYPHPKRDPIKNYFPLPNEIYMLDLTPGELAVYSYLMHCENRKTHRCHPAYSTIGEAVKLSKNTVTKCVRGLCEKRLIAVEPTTIITKRGLKRNGTLCYTIRPIEEAIRYRFERQAKKAEKEMAQRRAQEKLDALARVRGDVLTPGHASDAQQEPRP